jgi:capsular polysaccharide biosynthesis protein
MNQNSNDRIVTLRDLWNILRQRIVILAAVALLVASFGYLLAQLTYEPVYSSTATLYILRDSEHGDYSIGEANTEYALALKVVNDCTYMLKSRSVVDQVIADLDLETTYEVLSANISTNNPTSTRVLEVTVQAGTAKDAKAVVDSICTIGENKIAEAMGYDQVNVYEKGTLPKRPSNPVSILLYAIIGMAAAAVVYVWFVVAFLMDDRIRTEEDIQRYLGLSILGDIVNVYDEHKNRHGYGHGSKSGTNTKKRGY